MATTPELHEPQIAAARAQAWHQNWQAVAPQTTPQAEAQIETQSGTQSDNQAEAPLRLTAETQLHAGSDEEPALESDDSESGDELESSEEDDETESDDDAEFDDGSESDDDSESEDESESGDDYDSDDESDSDGESESDENEDDFESDNESESEPVPATQPTAGAAASPTPATSTGSRILTLEAARDFVNSCGILLFGPRSLGAPAPSLVEATLGAAKSSVTAGESEIARSLVARLVAEGSAVPLNLLGGPGDVPDFIVSTAAFPFVFTLRGDKGWKRAPETSGAVKVTTLALHVYEVLTEKGSLTVAEIVNEVGREITDSAVVRALSELWALVRVIPSLGQGEGATRWELTTARFLKAVKAGANAGQPTALSALISLYLGQAFLATEDEICAYLSPLTARSRVRDVLHGLSAGRQLSEAVLEGKTVLFLPDSLPDFSAATPAPSYIAARNSAAGSARNEASAGHAAVDAASGASVSTERIRRFDGGSDAGRDRSFRGKPAARPDSRFGGGAGRGPRPSRPASRGEDRPFGNRPARPSNDRPARPFNDRPARPSAGAPSREGAGDRPSFSRPWDEEKRDRPARPSGDRPAFGARDSRPPRREAGSSERPAFGNRDRGDRPTFRRDSPGSAPPFRPRPENGGKDRPFRSSFGAGENAASYGDRGPRTPREEGRPPRREASGFLPRRDARDASGDRPRPFRPSGDRPSGDRPSGPRPSRPRSSDASGSFAPRQNFDRPSREGGSDSGRSFGGGGGFRPREQRSEGFRPREDRAGGPPRSGDRGPQGRPPFREGGSGKPFGERPQRSFGDRPERGSDGPRSRPAGQGADRGAFRPNGFSDRPSRGPAGGSGGFKRGPGGPGRAPGSFSRGPGGADRGPGGADRGPGSFKRGPRPEDEA